MVCEPVFERFQIFDSYASRPGKGIDACLKRAMEFCRKYRFFLKLDIQKFFDSIDHLVLMRLLWRLFKDVRLLNLLEQIIFSYETTPGHGVPIGNLTSQYFANLYLSPLDHLIKEQWRIGGYLRYMDDFVLFSNAKSELQSLQQSIADYLAQELHLSLNPAILNRCDAGLPYLGYRVRACGLRLNQRSRRRFRDKIRVANAMECPEMALALIAFVNRADSVPWLRKVLNPVN